MASDVSVAGIAVEDGRVFVAKRNAGGALGGKWEFPGGKAEAGETDEEALVREYGEEFGASVQAGALIGESSFEHGGIRRTLRAYRIGFQGRAFALREHTACRWVSQEELAALDFADSDKRLFPFVQALL